MNNQINTNGNYWNWRDKDCRRKIGHVRSVPQLTGGRALVVCFKRQGDRSSNRGWLTDGVNRSPDVTCYPLLSWSISGGNLDFPTRPDDVPFVGNFIRGLFPLQDWNFWSVTLDGLPDSFFLGNIVVQIWAVLIHKIYELWKHSNSFKIQYPLKKRGTTVFFPAI